YSAEAFRRNPFTGDGLLQDFPNVDGVVALTHKTGCGMAAEGGAMDVLRRTIAGYARHVNFAAVVVVGLGCEANQIGNLLAAQRLRESGKLQTLVIQEAGGARRTVETGIERVKAVLAEANVVKRVPAPASHLPTALQFGGPARFYGLTPQ